MHKKYKEQLKDGPDMKRIYKLLAEAGIWTALSEKLLVIASKFTVCDWLLIIASKFAVHDWLLVIASEFTARDWLLVIASEFIVHD
jgi:hypothetical protein